MKLANLTQRVGDLLQVTKLLTVFEVYDSEEKAICVVRKRRGRLISAITLKYDDRAPRRSRALARQTPVEELCDFLPLLQLRPSA